MNSQLFREELERVVGDSIRESGADGISALLSDVMNIKSGSCPASSCVVPINDIRGIDSMVYAKGEKLLRCKLAAVYRLIDLHGWTQGIYNHVTARVSQDTEHFLLNPFGMMYNEVTASSLVKVNMQGDVVEEGTTNFGVNQAGFMLHSAIHAARPDIKCVVHLHTPSITAISTMKCGLLPLSQESCLIGDVSYHSYNGIVVDPEERQSIAKDLGPNNKVMFLRNHGVVCCGGTIEEAFHVSYHTVLACDTQLKMMPYGLDNLVLIDDEVRRKTFELGQRGGGGVNTAKKEWGIGELETGTTDPKKITKWVSEGSPSHSTPIKIESSNQFVPMNSNPKEFKKVQKLMKEGRRLGGVHAGPESKVLDGVSWEEVKNMQDAQTSQARPRPPVDSTLQRFSHP